MLDELRAAERLMNAGRDYSIGNSRIHGKGVIAGREFKRGELIGTAVRGLIDKGLGGMDRTPMGVYANHQEEPNARLEKVGGGDVYALRATKDISSRSEVTMSYWDTPWFVAKPHHIDPRGFRGWK